EAPGRHPFEFFDFGVRRRYSGSWQEEEVATLAREDPQYFKGTSNVWLAKNYHLVPSGTMAHEYLQSYHSFGVRLRDFQKAALEDWVQEY
ncbi:nicotinate phosphoribosyltransferase, partial [Acinetobacter baumannii]